MPQPVMQKTYGIIPARFASTRFPGKPLAEIHGKPMIWHVFKRASAARLLSHITVATDDDRIASACDRLEIPWVMTSKEHPSGTDRICEAARTLGYPDDSVIINIQGDEPLVSGHAIDSLASAFFEPGVEAATIAARMNPEDACDPNRVKVVCDSSGDAIYFSRSPIPFHRDTAEKSYLLHIGLYGFRFATLKRFVSLPEGDLEKTEKLEQLRLLENKIPIRIVITDHFSIGVDTPKDLARVEELLAKSDGTEYK